MLKHALLLLTFAAPNAPAATPKAVQAGSIANSWIQGGLRVTENLFDLGIQGRGFFALQMPNGDTVFTRHGAFYMDKDGYLSHKSMGGRLVMEPSNLGEALMRRNVPVKSMRVGLDGTIQGIYADGYVVKIAVVKLATFQNARKLRRSGGEHALYATEASGDAFYGLPQTETFGSVYAFAIEELDDPYELSLD